MDSLTPRPPISAMDHHLHSFASCGGSYAVVHGSTQTPLGTLKTLPKKGATAIFASSLNEKNAPLLHSLESVWKHLSPQFTLRGSNWYCGFPHLFTGFVANFVNRLSHHRHWRPCRWQLSSCFDRPRDAHPNASTKKKPHSTEKKQGPPRCCEEDPRNTWGKICKDGAGKIFSEDPVFKVQLNPAILNVKSFGWRVVCNHWYIYRCTQYRWWKKSCSG